MRTFVVGAALALAAATMAGCTDGGAPAPRLSSGTAGPAPSASAAASGSWTTSGEPEVLARDLSAPWSVVPLAGGGALIGQRDDGKVLELTAGGVTRDVGTVPGVVSGGEAGLNGLAVWTGDGGVWLYAYHASATDNRVVRMPLEGSAGSYRLGSAQDVFTGIAKAGNHDGGRLAFGPDGMLYVTTGDASRGDIAQDRNALNGKILRLTPAGDPAPGNPFGTAIWSYGHRNVQGIAWTSDGTMWASEFGQDTWDELNVIVPGGNYGWPTVEGHTDDTRFRDPLVVWPTDQASPSGIAAVGDTLFLAALRGERLWRVDTAGSAVNGKASVVLEHQGRLRDAVAAPDGSLWVLTNNTDGRGSPREGDDVLLRLALTRSG
jgi:glucose/arabinose dehydrogenase